MYLISNSFHNNNSKFKKWKAILNQSTVIFFLVSKHIDADNANELT